MAVNTHHKEASIPEKTNLACFDRLELMQINHALNLARSHIQCPCQSTKGISIDEIDEARLVLKKHNALITH